MYAWQEAVRGGAPPHKNNLIGTAARGWTQIGLFKMDTKALFISLALQLRVLYLITLDHRLYHQVDEPNDLIDFNKTSHWRTLTPEAIITLKQAS